MCSWSSASMIVDPRGGIARSPRTITFSSASRGSPSSRTGWPTTASLARTGNCTTSAPSRLSRTGSTSGTGIAASSEVTPSRRATGWIVVPWTIVETSTTKNATLKYCMPSSAPRSVTGNVANTIGVPPRSPAQPSISRSRRLNFAPSVEMTAAAGRAIAAVTNAIAAPSGMMSTSWAGNTSRPSVRKRPSCATHASPSWKVTIVRLAGDEAVPSTRPARKTARNPEPCSDCAAP
jgi:hypothetical protein